MKDSIRDYYEVVNDQIICDNQDKVRKVVDKMYDLNDWSIEVICNFKDASGLFMGKSYKDLSELKSDTSKVTSMKFMFCQCYNLTSIPELDTSNVTTMEKCFLHVLSLKINT